MTPEATDGRSRGGRWLWWLVLAAVVAVQLYGVYAPHEPAAPAFAGEDKLGHLLIFGAPAAVAVAARLRPRVVLPLLAVHAPLSEIVQHVALPGREGDVLDVLADLTGVCLGAGVGVLLRRRLPWS